MTNSDVVAAFLGSYQKHDWAGMHACLDPQVEFRDLAFKSIQGTGVFNMWRWFCVVTATRKAVQVPGFEILEAQGDRVRAEYWVRYSLESGGIVNYVIRSEFALRNAKIIQQIDVPTISILEFARMVKGFPACLLALTPLFQAAVRRRMRGGLKEFTEGKQGKFK